MTSPSKTQVPVADSDPETVPQEAPEAVPADAPVPDEWLPAVPRGHSDFREPPEAFVSAAELAPDHWLSVIDRHWDGSDDEVPPHWAVVGRWRSDDDGEIVEWQENPHHRPSPDTLGWGPPDGPADTAARLAATGYDSGSLLVFALVEEDMAVCVDERGYFDVVELSDGTQAVPVFPVPPEQGAHVPPHEVMAVPDLLECLPEGKEILFLSSSAPVHHLVLASSLQASKELLERYEHTGEIGERAARPRPLADAPGRSATSSG